jgi:hypothetical protein
MCLYEFKENGGILIEMLARGFSYLFSKQFENILPWHAKKIQITTNAYTYRGVP